ncbi:glycine zipper domain-containing protein [Bosea caraganae]|nr:glycine zipper domain-containing protein [Bosea caraganae]
MKKILIIAAFSTTLAACTAHEERTAGGALIGAGAGAIIGGAVTGRPGGALAGAAIGGAGGALVGSATSRTRTCVGRDEFGRRVRFDC